MQLTPGVIDRLKRVIQEAGLTPQEATELFLSPPLTFWDIYNGKIKELPGYLEIELWGHYRTNPEWLETGEGPETIDQYYITNPDEIMFIQNYRNMTKEQQTLLLNDLAEAVRKYRR